MFDRVERCSLRVESERESRKKRHEILTRAKVQDSGSSGGFVVEAEKYQTTSRRVVYCVACVLLFSPT